MFPPLRSVVPAVVRSGKQPRIRTSRCRIPLTREREDGDFKENKQYNTANINLTRDRLGLEQTTAVLEKES